jgi:hypothetical protein
MYKHTLTALRTLQHLLLPPTYNKFRGCKHPTCHEFRGCRHFQVCPQHTPITTKGSHAPCSRSHQFRGCTATSRQPSCQPTQPNENTLRNDGQQSYAMPPHQLAHPLAHEPEPRWQRQQPESPPRHEHQITSTTIQCTTTLISTRLRGGSHETATASTRYGSPITTHHTTGE